MDIQTIVSRLREPIDKKYLKTKTLKGNKP